MASGERQIARLGDITFHGKVTKNVERYSKTGQQLSRDLARQFQNDATAASKAIRKLHGHPLLFGVDVYLQARWVTRRLRRSRDLALALSAELVKFNIEYRRRFLEIDDRSTKTTRKVDI